MIIQWFFFFWLKEISGYVKTHYSKALQRAYDSLQVELDKLPPFSSKKTGTSSKEEIQTVKDPMWPLHLGVWNAKT